MTIQRRDFLRGAAGMASAAALGSTALGRGVSVRSLDPRSAAGKSGRSLILIQLSGGNDGLSTVVPYADDELRRVRSTTLHDPKKLLRIDDHVALNPRLKHLRSEYDGGKLAIVQGAGYPNPVRSHFKSMEVWHTARRAGRTSGDGWIGRLAASTWADGGAADSVVHFGGRAPYSLYSTSHPPVALVSPTGYRWFGDSEVYAMGGSSIEALCEHEPDPDALGRNAGRDRALAALRATLDDANESSRQMRAAAASYTTDVTYPKHRLAASLRDIAALLAGGVGTRIFSVLTGGYDTHTNQLGSHDRNMASLDSSLAAFLKDIRRSEAGRNAIVVVFSEFGRRVAENGSKGHDHGKAGPMFVVGEPVRGGLFGEHPSLTELDQGDLVHTTDFRSVYGTLLDRWFDVPQAEVLGAEYAPIDFV